MGKNKYKRFTENETFELLHQPQFEEVFRNDFPLKGRWHEIYFKNEHPIILELGCGKGEYTIALARRYPDKNFIGIDIKGARLWRGAKTATEERMSNVSFIRTRIDFIESFFAENEVAEIWITFPDPQPKAPFKRLTSTRFLNRYRKFLQHDGSIHLKTDSQQLHKYTKDLVLLNEMELVEANTDIYDSNQMDELLSIKTFYEQQFLSQGLPITYLHFKMNGVDTLIEPKED